MKPFHRFTCLLAVFLLFAAMTPCVSAFTLSSVKVDPQGSQPAGTPMTVTFTIAFSSKSNLTFPAANELLLNTNLVNAQWVPVLVLNGMETSLPSKKGNGLILPGSVRILPVDRARPDQRNPDGHHAGRLLSGPEFPEDPGNGSRFCGCVDGKP